MNSTSIKGILILIPASLLLVGSLKSFSMSPRLPNILMVIGAVCLTIVPITHICEGLQWFTFLHWGDENSIGHYIDLLTAVIGVILFPAGYFLDVIRKQKQ